MINEVRVSHVIWGYLGGGVDSVLDNYLEADKLLTGQIASHVVIVRPPGSMPKKIPSADITIDVVPHGTRSLLRAARVTASHIRENRSDVVFLNGFNATILGFFLRRFMPPNTRFVSTYHGAYFARSLSEKFRATIFNYFENQFFRRHAATVIAVSHNSAALLAAAGVPDQKIIALHNAIGRGTPEIQQKSHSAADGKQGAVRIITVSRLVPAKGIHVLIAAFGGVAEMFPKAELVIVGDGPLEQELKTLVRKSGLSNRVQFLGNRTDIADLLATADIFAMTSRQENHSISILEAMRAGLPLVVTDVGGSAESVRDGQDGFLVADLDTSAAEKAIASLVSSPKMRARFGASARARFEQEFESSVLIRNLKRSLDEIVAANGTGNDG